MTRNLKYISIIFFTTLIIIPSLGQVKKDRGSKAKNANLINQQNLLHNNKSRDSIANQDPQIKQILDKIKTSISSGNIESVSSYLSPQTYLNLSNGISGYYSANQAYYVLEDFLKTSKAISFDFNEISLSGSNPFTTGIYNYEKEGKRGTAHIYIQLRKSKKNWTITQITIN